MNTQPIIWSSERSAHLVLAEGDGDSHSDRVVHAYKALRSAGLPHILDLVPASTTILVVLDPLAADPDAIVARAWEIASNAAESPGEIVETRTVVIPVCYDEDLAPDLMSIASGAGMTAHQAAALHASVEYTVRFLGFSPGFAYLAGLPGALHAPRHASPRPRVRAGSVGIAGARTGIYPSATPGGWRLIGATPLRMFDASLATPSPFRAGDRVRFRAISRDEYEALAAAEGNTP